MADSLESPKEDKADLENLPDVEKLDLTDHTGPPEEEEGKMDLKKLPFLPRLLIMKYLLQSDLRNLRQTCPEMYKSIEVNRLLKHEVFELKIIGRNKNSASNCAIKIRKKRRCNGTILPFLNFCDLNGTEEGASIWHESSLLRWIEEKLYSSKIEALEIEMMDFVEKEWIELVRLLDKVDMQVGKVTVNHCYINSKECTQLICFLTKLRPKSLVLIGNVFRAQHLFVKSFMEILPTFDSLDIMNYNWESDDRNFTVPSNFFKFPKKISDKISLRLHIDSLKMSIHAWWNNELEIDIWMFTIPQRFHTVEALAAAIDLPSRHNYLYIVYRNPTGKNLWVNYRLEAETVFRIDGRPHSDQRERSLRPVFV